MIKTLLALLIMVAYLGAFGKFHKEPYEEELIDPETHKPLTLEDVIEKNREFNRTMEAIIANHTQVNDTDTSTDEGMNGSMNGWMNG